MKDQEAKRAAIALLRRGLITMPEAAALAGISRQLIKYWTVRAKVDWRRSRTAIVAKAWRKEILR